MGNDEICLSFLVRQAWLNMRSVMDSALATHDLSVAQYATLLVLDEQPGASVADVARAVASTRQSANELLAGMERATMVERHPHPQDRRSQKIHLTALGRSRLEAARPVVHARESELEVGFDAGERAMVREWLARMARAGHD
ncbi:MarR family winged helix-turn-helix transcriptional regulator [Nonomuraea aurantiaca]|uniref:MarR family winged helix-turn-helix transcriptional regulator n=1 Tax=Nonomuraea aurantiaca TaxID=2878562 RepID=UPI001CD9D328|nr:MarR family transcriptional regulator [Nonomuraea aurantiaca]MCA2229589.1 MarR family transcriptional regulator [Nonomuraea aurantiaca]